VFVMNFARGIIKHRMTCGMMMRALGHADPTAWRGRVRKRPCRSRSPSIDDSLFVGTVDGIRILRALPLNELREEPATANGFREPRMQDTPASTMTFM
jgi:hypothetical protein